MFNLDSILFKIVLCKPEMAIEYYCYWRVDKVVDNLITNRVTFPADQDYTVS